MNAAIKLSSPFLQ